MRKLGWISRVFGWVGGNFNELVSKLNNKEEKEMTKVDVLGVDEIVVRGFVEEGEEQLQKSRLCGNVILGGFGYDSVVEVQGGIVYEYMDKIGQYKKELQQVMWRPEVYDWLITLFDTGLMEQLRQGELVDFMHYYETVGRMKLIVDSLAESKRYQRWLITYGAEISDDVRYLLQMLVQNMESVIGLIQLNEGEELVYKYLVLMLLENWK